MDDVLAGVQPDGPVEGLQVAVPPFGVGVAQLPDQVPGFGIQDPGVADPVPVPIEPVVRTPAASHPAALGADRLDPDLPVPGQGEPRGDQLVG